MQCRTCSLSSACLSSLSLSESLFFSHLQSLSFLLLYSSSTCHYGLVQSPLQPPSLSFASWSWPPCGGFHLSLSLFQWQFSFAALPLSQYLHLAVTVVALCAISLSILPFPPPPCIPLLCMISHLSAAVSFPPCHRLPSSPFAVLPPFLSW